MLSVFLVSDTHFGHAGVCVEQTDFTPILFENVIKRIKEEGGEVGFRNGNGPIM